MALKKLYSRINWENSPSENTAVNETNLNRMDAALNELDNRVIEQESLKADKASLNNLIADWKLDEETGIITITKFDGSKILFDLNIEKIPVDFKLSEDGILTMTTDDGTKFTANIGAMIPVLTFEDSDTIAVSVSGTGVNKTYSFSIKNGSVTADMLQPNYLAEVQTAAGQASGAASEAVQSAASAAQSASSALSSKESAENSAANASESASSAQDSAVSAASSAASASSSASSAQENASSSSASAASAAQSASSAQNSATAAETSETNAQNYSSLAEQNASTATDKATLAKSYAVGGTGTRPGEDTDNALYYMNQAKKQTGDIPTKMSQLENDAGFITAAVDNLINYYRSSQLYTKTEVDAKLSAIPKFSIVAVDVLPTENISETTIYLLKEQESGTNKCSEWVYINSSWEKLGDIDIDLSGYLQKTGDGSNLTEAFSQASSLANIATGENHSTIFGKIAKAIATLISHISTAATTSVLGHVKVDSAMSSSSTNPVQNKVVNSALGNKLATTGDASNTTVAFTEATAMAELATGEKMSTLFGKLKLTIKNVMSILNLLGNTDISAIGDGTITGAISTQNSNLSNKNGYIAYASNDSLENIIENNISNMKQFIEYTFHVDNIIGTPFPSNNNVIVKVIITNDNKNSYNVEVADTTTSKKYYITKTNGTFGPWTTSIVDLDSNLQNANKSITMNAFDNGVLANGLLVDLYDKNGVNNKPQLVQNGITSQIPSDCAWGTREVFFHSANETGQVSYLTIKITGSDTNGKPGIWQNLYNGNDWVGWTRLATT